MIEYATINDNQDLWLIDYNQGIATLREDITIDDLETNNEEFTDLMEHSIYEYIESKGYDIDGYKDTKKGYTINFHKRTFIYLSNKKGD